MKKPLWEPSEVRSEKANVTQFIAFVNEWYGQKPGSYSELYDWSVSNTGDFWAAVWDFIPIIASRPYDSVVDDLHNHWISMKALFRNCKRNELLKSI